MTLALLLLALGIAAGGVTAMTATSRARRDRSAAFVRLASRLPGGTVVGPFHATGGLDGARLDLHHLCPRDEEPGITRLELTTASLPLSVELIQRAAALPDGEPLERAYTLTGEPLATARLVPEVAWVAALLKLRPLRVAATPGRIVLETRGLMARAQVPPCLELCVLLGARLTAALSEADRVTSDVPYR